MPYTTPTMYRAYRPYGAGSQTLSRPSLADLYRQQSTNRHDPVALDRSVDRVVGSALKGIGGFITGQLMEAFSADKMLGGMNRFKVDRPKGWKGDKPKPVEKPKRKPRSFQVGDGMFIDYTGGMGAGTARNPPGFAPGAGGAVPSAPRARGGKIKSDVHYELN